MITYEDWRQRYVRQYQEGLYVAYNGEGEFMPENAVTVSEASGYLSVPVGSVINKSLSRCVPNRVFLCQVWSASQCAG